MTNRPHVAPPPRLASIAEGADYYNVSTKTIRRYIAQGLITGYRVGPRLIKVDLDELDAQIRPVPTALAPGQSSRTTTPRSLIDDSVRDALIAMGWTPPETAGPTTLDHNPEEA